MGDVYRTRRLAMEQCTWVRCARSVTHLLLGVREPVVGLVCTEHAREAEAFMTTTPQTQTDTGPMGAVEWRGR